MKLIRIWLGPKEKYSVVGLSCYVESPDEIRSVVTTVETALKAKFPDTIFKRAQSVARLFPEEG